jgi:hypothetical protein
VAKQRELRVCAIGDIAFAGVQKPDVHRVRPAVRRILDDADLVVGNLEGPLTEHGSPSPRKCMMRGDPSWAEALARWNAHVLSLANNHIMDYGVRGLLRTIEVLRAAGLHHVGAGLNELEANAPVTIERRGVRLAFLARSMVTVRGRCYASGSAPGAAFFNLEETLGQIRRLRREVDVVVVLMHWGVEHYGLPTPSQRRIGQCLAEEGADAVLGHHPHVFQGIEVKGRSPVAYSLGNFLFNDFEWLFRDGTGNVIPQTYKMLPSNREGLALKMLLTGRGLSIEEPRFTVIRDNGQLDQLESLAAERRVRALSRALRLPGYSLWWWLYAMRQEWRLRLRSQLSVGRIVANIHQIRPRHLRELVDKFRRSLRIVAGRSANPYDP